MAPKVIYVLWKDLVLRRNHLAETIVEVVLPILIIIIANLSVKQGGSGEEDAAEMEFRTFIHEECSPTTAIKGNVIYEPSTAFTTEIMTKAACYAGLNQSYVKHGSLSENFSNFTFGVKFHSPSNADDPPKILNYTLFPSQEIRSNVAKEPKYFPSRDYKNFNSNLMGLVQLQRGIDAAFLDKNGITAEKIRLEDADMVSEQSVFYLMAIYFSVFFALTFMVSPVVSRIVMEKHSGAKEMMLMMGVARWELWVSKFLDILIFNLITVSGMVLFLYLPLGSGASHLNHNPLLFWSITIYGLIGVTCFLFFMSSIFSKPVVATFITQIFWLFAFFLSSFILFKFIVPSYVTTMMLLLPHIAVMKAVVILLESEMLGQKASITEPSFFPDKMTLKIILIMISVDIVVYLILALYIDRLNPGKYGVPQPFYFIFKKSFWKASSAEVPLTLTPENQSRGSFEKVPRSFIPGLSLMNVSKVYRLQAKTVKIAVDNVTIDFYHGEISGLLGHNGAGKTTLFSMISGLTYPTSGKILINGYDLVNNITSARRSLGLCPQFDMLFDDLTAIQIITFYGLIKGMSLDEAKMEATGLISTLKLTNVENTRACKLSGGQRRKVSLAVALIGGSKVLLLDEPSSGMDPEIRREIWQVLLVLRGERTIILSTHFMEEADALCDRIAIMNHGKIMCYGSPMFLKSKFGKGYVLSVVVFSTDKIKSVVDYVKETAEAKFKSQNVRTLTFEIPEKQIEAFPTLFAGLEEKQKKNEIASYAVSFSALEDVFLRFSGFETDVEPVIDTSDKRGTVDRDRRAVKLKKRVTCFAAFQLWALIIKKWIIFKRDVILFSVFSIFAALFLIFVVLIQEHKGGQNPQLSNSEYDDYSSEYASMSENFYPYSVVLFSNKTEESKKKHIVELAKSYKSDAKEVTDIPKGVEEQMRNNFFVFGKKIILGVDFVPEDVKLYYSQRAMYIVPIPLNFLHNFLLKSADSECEILTTLNFQFTDLDFSLDFGPKCRLTSLTDFSGFQTLFYMLGPLNEKISGAKDLQLMLTSGVLYWLAHLLFDLITFLLFIGIIYIGLAYSVKDSIMLHNAGFCMECLFLWGCGLILVSYLITVDLKSVTAAFTINIVLYTISAFLLSYLLSFGYISRIFRFLHPNCIIKPGFTYLCEELTTTALTDLLVYDIILFGILVLKDSGSLTVIFNVIRNFLCRVSYSDSGPKDDFIAVEEELVRKTLASAERERTALVANNLKRWFCKKFRGSPAVSGVSFIVHKGECFGLLGVNGAGKTTTFKMLIGELTPSEGSIYIYSRRLNICNRQQILYSVGYCPQYGGFLPNFKGRELLMFFGRLRGVASNQLEKEVKKWLEKVNLMEYEEQKCGQYSGGNQRKLCTAIALIGDPLLVFLDEPTSGVDPAARRNIWNAIEAIQKAGQSIVLTSHSMDECEALCARLGIMVEGKFRCIGEITTIKNRFGQGFCIEIKLTVESDEKSLKSLKRAMEEAFETDCELVDEHLTMLQYHIKNKHFTWSNVFSILQNIKRTHSVVESYSASSTTLEQVFIYFAKNK